jgi:hypothetical protein
MTRTGATVSEMTHDAGVQPATGGRSGARWKVGLVSMFLVLATLVLATACTDPRDVFTDIPPRGK